MVEQPEGPMSVVLDRLYRVRWWISAVLVTALVFVVGDDQGSRLSWAIFGLFAVLVWAPALVRWGRIARASRDG